MALLSINDAINEVIKLSPLSSLEIINLKNANNRILAEDIIAQRPQPPFNSSAMDGYGVILSPEELEGFDGVFEIIGISSAGKSFEGEIKSGQAIRIFTGAAVPEQVKTIIIQEDVINTENSIGYKSNGLNIKSNIRKLGGDFNQGEILIGKNTRLDAYYLSLIAAAGIDNIKVYKRPQISLLCNGDELAIIGQTPNKDQIFESASFAIKALCEEWGAEVNFLGIASDNKNEIKSIISNASADLLLIIGGASVGDFDLVQPCLNELGFESRFSKVNIKPGKPTWAGKLKDMAVLGLPGNPASALVCAEIFLKPFILNCLSLDFKPNIQKAFLAHDLKANGSRVSYSRAIVQNTDGKMTIKAFNNQDSSLIKIFSMANALLIEPANQASLKQGEMVEYIPLKRGINI